MKQTGYIEHQGIVTQVNENSLSVSLINTSSCSGCHVKGFCHVSDVDNKSVEVLHTANNNISKGDKVIVNYERILGPLALLLGYMVPFFLMIAVLVISLTMSGNEAVSGLLSLVILVPYYITLFFFRDSLKTRFAFTIRTIKNQSV
ncbi:MAG: SoxR reducing system RseC family protein [Cyclobacteriaceae bacterium]|nr:SoxR reducing system RseC family protein [Cyclobacteriaceae bacterium]